MFFVALKTPKMFQSLLETAKTSQLCSPFYARCEAAQGESRSMDLKSNVIPGRNIIAASASGNTKNNKLQIFVKLTDFTETDV